jgi:hypothetical protein
MKITRRKLKELISESSQISAMKSYDKDTQDIMTTTTVILRGILTLSGEELSEEDEYEYGQDIRAVLEKDINTARRIAEIFVEVRSGSPMPASVGVPEYDMASQLRDTMSGKELEDIGADYDEAGDLK